MMSISVIFTLFMSFFCNRRKTCSVNCCYGHPGPVVPLNMIDSYENRRGIAIAFAITVSATVEILLGDYRLIVGQEVATEIATYPKYLSSLIKIGFAFFISMLTYPFFVCQTMNNKLAGSIFGLLFCLTWVGLEIYKTYYLMTKCLDFYKDVGLPIWLNVLMDLPKYVCLLLLIAKFAWCVVKIIKQREERKQNGEVISWLYFDDTDWHQEYMYIHVSHLLNRKKEVIDHDKIEALEDVPFTEKMKIKAKNNLYTYRPGFKYSTRIIASSTVAVFAVYKIFLYMFGFGYFVFVSWWDLIFSNEAIQSLSEWTGYPVKEIEKYGYCIIISYWLATVFAFFFFGAVLMNALMWYRRHIMRLRRGDRTFLPTSVAKGSLPPASLLGASLKFAGFQVGYSVWGYMIIFLIGLVAFIVVSTQIFLPMFTKRLSFLLILLIDYWPTLIAAVTMVILQMLMARCCFLGDSDTLAVNNRRAFHIVSYFMFYFNIFLGLVSCLIRIIFSMILGVLFLQRLQKSALPRSFERRDPGYLAYLGYLLLEHQHANPILQCFVRLLLDAQNKKLIGEFSSPVHTNKVHLQVTDSVVEFAMEEDVEITRTSYSKKRANNRWHLFIMLSRNPSILKFRKRAIKHKKKHITKGLFSFMNIDELEIEKNNDEMIKEGEIKSLNGDADTKHEKSNDIKEDQELRDQDDESQKQPEEETFDVGVRTLKDIANDYNLRRQDSFYV